MLVSDKVPIGSRKTGTGTGQIWLGNGTGVGCNVMRLLLGKRPVLAVRPEAVAGDCNGVDVVAIVVWLDEVGLDGKCHPQRWRRNRQDCRLRGNDDGECRISDGALEYFDEVNNGLLLGVAELDKRGGRGCIGEGLRQGTRCNSGCVDGGRFLAPDIGAEKIALFWRCARLWSLGHKVGSSDIVREQDLNTSRRPHGGSKCGSWQISRKLGPLFLYVQRGLD